MLDKSSDPVALRDRIDELEELVRQLKEQLAPPFIIPPEWGFTRMEQEIVRILVSRPYLTNQTAIVQLETTENSVGTMLSRIRQKFKTLHIEVKLEREKGWYMEREHKEKILAASTNWIKDHSVDYLPQVLEAAELIKQLASHSTMTKRLRAIQSVVDHINTRL